jgi:hypothetical protein
VKQMLCEWCGWLLTHCPCQPDTPENRAIVEARHAAAVRLAARRPVEPTWRRETPAHTRPAPMRLRRSA